MKILLVNSLCGFFGGVEQNIADTATGLAARGHRLYLAYGRPSDKEGLDHFTAPFSECCACAELGDDSTAASFADILRRLAPDVVYFHKCASITPFLAHLTGVRAVRMIHDHDLCCPTGFKYFRHNGRVCHHKADWRCWLDGGFLNRSPAHRLGFKWASIGGKVAEMRRHLALDAFVVGSRFMHEELAQNGFPPDKIHILAPIIRSTPAPPTPVPAAPRILYVGQLVRGKGVDLLLRALQQVRGDFSAVIAGTGNAEAGLKALCTELGLDAKVTFTGWIDNKALAPLYTASRVVVVPSRWPEPFGMVGLEAMSHGRPVVGFNVGGIPDWLEDGQTGLLVAEQDTAAFAQALEQLLGDQDAAEAMGRNAYLRLTQAFSFERYMDQMEVLLDGSVTVR